MHFYWTFLNKVDNACEAWCDTIEDILHENIGHRLTEIFDSLVDLLIGIIYTIIAFPIGLIGVVAHRLAKYTNEERLLRENWRQFYDWYKETKRSVK